MPRAVLSIILLQLLISEGICQAQGGKYLKVDTAKYVVWNNEQPLTWKNYPYINSSRVQGSALTAVTHSVRGGIEKGKPKFEVYVLFKVQDSWTTDSTDVRLLAHEQLHFDIAEMYGRMVRKQIAAMGAKGVKKLLEYRKAIKYLLAEFKNKSLEYDRETAHGLAPDEQERWQTFVSSELQRLHEYM